MKGNHATSDEIAQAFYALDSNHSGDINVHELAVFTPIIASNCTAETLMNHIGKVDRNYDYKMNLAEFTDFIKKNIGRQIALNRV